MKKNGPHTILMTADTIGGVWNYSLILTKAFRLQHVEVHLATMGNFLNEDQRKEAAALPNLTIHESNYALEWMDNCRDEVEEAGKWLLQLEHNLKPDLIHLNNYAFANLSWHAPVLTVGHSCVLSWWNAVLGKDAPASWNSYATLIRNGLQKTDTVASVTRHMLNELKRFYGPFSSSKVIYNAQDQTCFFPGTKQPEIFSIGRIWDEGKNIKKLFEISPGLQWPVFVAGGHRGEIKSGSSENSCLLGKLSSEEIAVRLKRASIYVLPAKYEPFGLSVLEAALSGCSLVLGDIPSLREIWGDSALYADPDNAAELKMQVERLIIQPDFRNIMAGKALETSQKYSISRMREAYWQTYCELYQAYN